MTAVSSSPSRLHLSEASSPTVTRTPLPPALTKPAPPALPDSSPCVLPAPGPSTTKTPASAYARPSSPTAHKEADYATTSSPTAISPNAYALRPAKRARLSAGPSPVTPAPSAPVKAAAGIKATPSCGRGASSAMAKRMSDAGCKMGSFKVHVGQGAKTPATAGGAKKKATPAAAAKASPGPSATPSGGMKIAGFRHLSSATPIASRTVAKQPRVEETKMLAHAKRAHDDSVAAELRVSAPASVGMAKVPSVLQPVPASAKAEEGGLSPVSCGKAPWSREDDAAIMRFHGATQGDFVWIARALRPVRFADEVAQRHKQLSHPGLTRSLSYSGPAGSPATRTPAAPSSNAMSKSLSHAPSLFALHNNSTPSRAPLAPNKPTTFVIPNPNEAARTPAPHPPASLSSHALAASASTPLSRSYSCSSLPPRHPLQQRPLSASVPASAGRPVLPPLLSSSLGASAGMARSASLSASLGSRGPLRPMMPARSGSLGGGTGMVRLPSLREVMNEPWAGWKGFGGKGVGEGEVAARRA